MNRLVSGSGKKPSDRGGEKLDMKCPLGCQRLEYSFRRKTKIKADLACLRFHSISKSGKTLYFYYQCPKCKRVFKRGHRIRALKGGN